MKQVLHIFRKDLRHHWPETLLSLLLLVLYCWREMRNAYPGMRAHSVFIVPWMDFVPVLLPLALALLVVRLVQDETLVGDRQWWVTKPYRWFDLLAAKLLFLAVWLGIPLFFAECFLLRAGGFAITPHLAELIGNLFGLIGALIGFCFVVACLTRNLGHAIIAVIGLFLLMTGFSSFERFIPDHSLASLENLSDKLSGIVVAVAVLVAVLWQFARRKTLRTRGIVLSAIAVTWVIQIATPYRALMERKYPSAAAQDQPFQLTLRSVASPPVKPAVEQQPSPQDVSLRIPLQVSGIAQNDFVVVEAERLTIEDRAGGKWPEPWVSNGQFWWPEDGAAWSVVSVKNSVYQKLKAQPVALRLEMAVTEYRLTDQRDLLVQRGEYRVPSLGICGSELPIWTVLSCRLPFVTPLLVATFDPATTRCPAGSQKMEQPGRLLRFENLRTAGASGTWINPVKPFSIYFFSHPSFETDAMPPGPQDLCPDDVVRLATPLVYRRVRTEALLEPVELEKVRLNVSGRARLLGFSRAVTWDVR